MRYRLLTPGGQLVDEVNLRDSDPPTEVVTRVLKKPITPGLGACGPATITTYALQWVIDGYGVGYAYVASSVQET